MAIARRRKPGPGPQAAAGDPTAWAAGEALPDVSVTPDRYATIRYAGAADDFNPIHLDDDFAHRVGLPGRILHGFWAMAQVARAQTEAAGGPATLRRLRVEFRGMGVPEQEVVVRSSVSSVDEDGTVHVDAVCEQNGVAIVHAVEAEIRAPGSSRR